MVSSEQFALVAGSAIKPVAKVFLTCLAGAYVRRKGVLSKELAKGISGVIMNLFVPAFLFIRLVKAVSLDALAEWWPIPLFVCINILLGMLLGYAFTWAFRARCGEFRGIIIASCTVGNMGMLPLSLSDAACQPGLEKFSSRQGGYSACAEEAQAMVAFGLWVAGLAAFTIGDWLIRPRSGDDTELLQAYAQMEDGQAALPQTQTQTQTQTKHAQVTTQSPRTAAAAGTFSWQSGAVSLLKNLSNPPTICTFLGLVCGSTPALKWLLLSIDSPLSPVGGAMDLMGAALVPCQLLVLGSNFGEKKEKDEDAEDRVEPAGGFGGGSLSFVVLAGICGVRLILLPVIGVILMYLMHRANLMPHDPLVEFIALLQFTTPTGMTLTTLCFLSLYFTLYHPAGPDDRGQKEISILHFMQYTFAIPAVSAAMMVYLAVQL